MQKKESRILTAAKLNKFDDIRKIFEKFDKTKAKKRLKETIDIDSKDSNSVTALHYAAKHDNIEMMSYLVSRGADIESMDGNGWRPISYACANNNIKSVKTLIQWKSSVNRVSLMEENSPLHIAAGFGYIDIVKQLMESGAIVHQQNKNKKTPMDVACENNHYGVVNVLLTASSKLLEESSQKNMELNHSMSSLFIKSPSMSSSHHIASRFKQDFRLNGDNDFKRRTIGSQSQLCTPMQVPKPKKSGSLNTIFLPEYVFQNIEKREDDKESTSFSKNKSNPTEIEVNLPYPSKFSTSEKLKIKSPLLAAKNLRFVDKNRRNNPSVIDVFSSAQFNYPNDVQASPSVPSYQSSKLSPELGPLSPSYKTEKRCLSNRSPFYSIDNTVSVSSFKPPLLGSSSETDSKPLYKCRKAYSVRREFGSESDIKDSPRTKEPSQRKQEEVIKSGTNHTYVRSPSLQDYESPQNRVMCNGTNSSENEEYTCSKWIKSLGLERIWDTLLKEGFESFLALSLASNDELLLLCDNNIKDWDTLKQNLNSLNIPCLSMLKFSTNLSDLLLQLGLECYISNFYENGYFYVQQTVGFQEINLNKLQIFKIGHRKLILECFSVFYNNDNSKIDPHVNGVEIGESLQSNVNDESKYIVDNSIHPQIENKEELYSGLTNDEKDIKSQIILGNQSVEKSKKLPPPIPFRSSSIISTDDSKKLTLDDILTPNSNKATNLNEKEDQCDGKPANPSSLDDIVNLLLNLGKELDEELNNI